MDRGKVPSRIPDVYGAYILIADSGDENTNVVVKVEDLAVRERPYLTWWIGTAPRPALSRLGIIFLSSTPTPSFANASSEKMKLKSAHASVLRITIYWTKICVPSRIPSRRSCNGSRYNPVAKS